MTNSLFTPECVHRPWLEEAKSQNGVHSPEYEISWCLRRLQANHLLPQRFQRTAIDVDRTPGPGPICTLCLRSLAHTVSQEVLAGGRAWLSWVLGTVCEERDP